MFVLRIIPSEWRLFCVLEVIGLSVALALLALRVTGNVAEVRGEGHGGCEFGNNRVFVEDGCDIYGWYFILVIHPLSVTIVSLLLNAIVASPKRFFEKHILESNSLQNWVFVFVLASWVLEPIFDHFDVYGWIFGIFSSYYIFISCYVLLLIWRALCICLRLRRGSGLLIATCRSVRCSSLNTLVRLYLVPACICLMVIILITTAAIDVDQTDVFQDAITAIDVISYALYSAWLIWSIFPRGNSVQGEAHETPVPAIPAIPAIGREPGAESYNRESGRSFMLTTNLIFGWVQAQALSDASDLVAENMSAENMATMLAFVAFILLARIGVGICAASSNEKGIAFWMVATWLLIDFDYFIFSWVFAKASRSVE